MNALTVILIIATIVSIIVTTYTSYKSSEKQNLIDKQLSQIFQLNEKNEKNGKRVKLLEDFCKTVYNTEKKYRNVIIIGPRLSGKSSIVTLWCRPDKLIKTLSPTLDFDTYDYKLDAYKKVVPFYDSEINVNREKHIEPTLKVYDYAGEDHKIPDAISKINEYPDCTIIMVFDSDPHLFTKNETYFSRTMIEKINNTLNDKKIQASSVKNVFVVFNKIDLYTNNASSFDSKLNEIKEKHGMCISNIQKIFGIEVQYLTTSATTNHNIVNLLQKIINNYSYEWK